MSDPVSIARAYLETWNETDAARCRALVQRHWTDDAVYADPMARVEGADQIAALVGAVHQRFAGFRFTLVGQPDGHGDYARLSWRFGPQGVPAPIEGSDVIVVRDGRIERVIGFIDRAPA